MLKDEEMRLVTCSPHISIGRCCKDLNFKLEHLLVILILFATLLFVNSICCGTIIFSCCRRLSDKLYSSDSGFQL